MSDALDEGLVQRIDARGTTEWSGTCYRYTGAHRSDQPIVKRCEHFRLMQLATS